jgi:Xaa-Pro dipeptidase
MLIDAAPETKGYTSDVSRTYPVNGKFTADQKLVYDIVLGTQKAGIEAFVPGTTWGDVNLATQQYMTAGLLSAGFVRGDIEELIQASVYSTFMPHGLGHSVGLDVHDIPFSGVAVPGNVYTVEPGIYFVEDLLDAALAGPYGYLYNEEVIDRFRGFGGVRIEDVIAVTADGNECLSCSTPKETEEIEAIFASFATPPGGSVSGESSDDALSTGAVVGVVAAAAVVGAVAVGAFFMMRGSKQKATTGDLNEKLVTDNDV